VSVLYERRCSPLWEAEAVALLLAATGPLVGYGRGCQRPRPGGDKESKHHAQVSELEPDHDCS
jgi:hypothetical protein